MLAKLPDWGQVLWDLGKRYIAIHGGRGSAKTRTVATALLLRAAETTLRVLCARQIQKSIKDSVKRVLDDEIERLGLEHFYTSTDTEIRGTNGSLFIFAGLQSNIDSIKSMEGVDVCWVDEAQSVRQEALDILIPTIRKPGSQIIFTWNPKNPKNPVDAKFRAGEPPPGTVLVEVNYTENPWFPDVLRAEMEYDRKRDLAKYRHIWKGEYLVLTDALIYKNWTIEAFDAPPGTAFRFGADWGYAQDPTVLVRGYQVGRMLYIDHEAWEIGCEVEDTPALFLTVPEAEKWPIVADSSRPETISHVKRHGFPKIQGAVKGPSSVKDGIAFVQSLDLVVHPRCTHVIDELESYSWKVDKETGEILPEPEDKHNHCIAEGQCVLTARGYVPIETVATDDKVLTRGGWRPVLFAGVTDYDRDIVKVTTTTGEFLCTPDHEVWTAKGFVRADALRYDDEIIGDTQWENLTTSRQLSGAVKFGADTQVASTSQIGVTSNVAPPTAPSGCIGRFGHRCMGLFRKVTTSIMSMATRATTLLRTLSALLQSNMPSIMFGATSAGPEIASTLRVSVTSPSRGTPARRGSGSTGGLEPWPTMGLFPHRNPAPNVGPSSLHEHSATGTGFVQTTASHHGAAPVALTTWTESARSVGVCSAAADTAGQRLVPGRVVTVQEAGRCARVYDLTVEEHHEFFVQGVLVSNCIDALRYACEAARRLQPVQRKAPKMIPSESRW